MPQGETLPGLDPACRRPAGRRPGYEPYPDRAAIEDGALGARAKPIVYLRDPVEAFILQVQGSARIRLPDGSRRCGSPMRAATAIPTRRIGRLLVEQGAHDARRDDAGAADGAGCGTNPEPARELMRQNRSYIFFRRRRRACARRTARSAAPACR